MLLSRRGALSTVGAGLVGLSLTSPRLALASAQRRLTPETAARSYLLRDKAWHVQGLEFVGGQVFLTSVDREGGRGYLHIFCRDGTSVRRVEVGTGLRFHVGGVARHRSGLLLPVAENRPMSTTEVFRYDLKTARLERLFALNDHLGAVCTDGRRIFGVNWDSRDIYTFDFKGLVLDKRPMGGAIAYQDIKFVNGQIVSGGDILGGTSGRVDWFDPDTLSITNSIEAGRTAAGVNLTHEGMAIDGAEFHFAPEDGTAAGVLVHVFSIPRPPSLCGPHG